MPQVSFLAVCAAIPVFLLSAQSRSVGIFMDFESTPGELSVQAMEREVNELLKPSGVSLDWHLIKDNHGDQPFAGLVVLKFKGACKAGYEVPNASDNAGETEMLASTKVDHGHVLPYSEVECDQVRKALAYLSPGAGQKERQRALGVAMGRVVAHELYHILAVSTSHAHNGIAKASHSLEDLVSPEKMVLTEEDSLAIAKGQEPGARTQKPE